jgi:hypothetical protein
MRDHQRHEPVIPSLRGGKRGAQLRVLLDEKLGRPTPEAIRRLAESSSHDKDLAATPDETAAPDEVRALADRAVALLRAAERSGDGAALDTAVTLLRQVSVEGSPSAADRADYLRDLSNALQIRSERTAAEPTWTRPLMSAGPPSARAH